MGLGDQVPEGDAVSEIPMPKAGPRPICPYCQNEALRVTGKAIYPKREDLHGGTYYQCPPCGAYVGCHPGTDKPLGNLANATLRALRSRAHGLFDPLWKSGTMKRKEAYQWLAGELGIEFKKCHIGWFDEPRCRAALAVLKSRETKPPGR